MDCTYFTSLNSITSHMHTFCNLSGEGWPITHRTLNCATNSQGFSVMKKVVESLLPFLNLLLVLVTRITTGVPNITVKGNVLY